MTRNSDTSDSATEQPDVDVNLPPSVWTNVDRYAAENQLTRPEAVGTLIAHGLDAEGITGDSNNE